MVSERQQQGLLVVPVELRPAWRLRRGASEIRRHLVPQSQRPLDRDPLEAERLVGQDLYPLALGEVAVQAGDLLDLGAR